MLIQMPNNLRSDGWIGTKQTNEYAIIAAPAPYRLLLFAPSSLIDNPGISGRIVDVSIGWHYDKNYVGQAYTLSKNVGLKHTKVTIRRVIEYTDEPVATMDKIFAKTPRNDGKRAEGGGRKPAYRPGQRITTSVSFAANTLEELKSYAQQEGMDVSKIVNEAVALYLGAKNTSRIPTNHHI